MSAEAARAATSLPPTGPVPPAEATPTPAPGPIPASCVPPARPASTGPVRVVHTMGTVFSLRAPGCPEKVWQEIEADWRRIDETYSPFRSESVTSRLTDGTLTVGGADAEARGIVRSCRAYNRSTGGWFDAWATGRFDPSGWVKGWSIARAARTLRNAGLKDWCINGGGDVQTSGRPEPGRTWRLGVAHPRRPGTMAVVLAAPDDAPFAVATSGTYERGEHVARPAGRPGRPALAVTVVGRDIAHADAMATAALAADSQGRDLIEDASGLEALGFDSTGSVWWTTGMPHFAPLPAPPARHGHAAP